MKNEYPQSSAASKPYGLWMSELQDGDAKACPWYEYIKHMREVTRKDVIGPNALAKGTVFHFDDDFRAKVLYVMTHEDAKNVVKKYGKNDFYINWKELSAEYDGIYVGPSALVRTEKNNFAIVPWLYVWEIPSLVVWNESAMNHKVGDLN